jgi:hypothetical protein
MRSESWSVATSEPPSPFWSIRPLATELASAAFGLELVVGAGEELVVGAGEELVVGVGEELVVGVGEELVVGVGEELVVGVGELGLVTLETGAELVGA